MIYLSCPQCESDVGSTFDTEEILSGMTGIRLVPVVDRIDKSCACQWSEKEKEEMIEAAEDAASDQD